MRIEVVFCFVKELAKETLRSGGRWTRNEWESTASLASKIIGLLRCIYLAQLSLKNIILFHPQLESA